MNIEIAIEILKKHNEWRRYEGLSLDKDMQSPKDIGIAIDTIVNHYKDSKVYLDNKLNELLEKLPDADAETYEQGECYALGYYMGIEDSIYVIYEKGNEWKHLKN